MDHIHAAPYDITENYLLDDALVSVAQPAIKVLDLILILLLVKV